MPSGESTPRASGLDSRCSPRSWLTSGGPSSRRLVVYQKVSGKPALLSSRPVALRVATDDCAFHPVYTLLGRWRLLTTTTGVGDTRRPRCRPAVACLGEDYPISSLFTRANETCRGRHDPRLIGKRFVIPIEEAFP